MATSLIVEIGASVARMQSDMNRITRTVDSATKRMSNMFRGVGMALIAAFSVRAIQQFTVGAIRAFAEQEAAENKLTVAMKNYGDYTEQSHRAMVEFAGGLQKITTYGDEMTIAMMANLKTYGMNEDALKEATIATMDLATAKGIDLKTASELVGKAFVGETGTLSRYGIIIKEVSDKSEKFSEVMKFIRQRFGGSAQAEIATYQGQVKQLSNAWGDLAEQLGKVATQSSQTVIPTLTRIIYRITDAINDMGKLMQIVKMGEQAALGPQAKVPTVRGLVGPFPTEPPPPSPVDRIKIDDFIKSLERQLEMMERTDREKEYSVNLDKLIGIAKKENIALTGQEVLAIKKTSDAIFDKGERIKETIKSEAVLEKYLADTYDEAAGIMKDYYDEIERGAAAVRESLLTPMEQMAKEQERLNLYLKEGGISLLQFYMAYEDVQNKYAPVQEAIIEKTKETESVARQLGMTFSSAFEDAIVRGNDLRSVLQGLYQDIIRIVAREKITTPLAGYVTRGLTALGGAIFGGGGGVVMPEAYQTGGIIGGSPGAAVPIIAHEGEGVFTPDQMRRMGGTSITIHQTIIGVDAQMRAYMVQAKEQAKAEILASMRRGGTFARAVGKA